MLGKTHFSVGMAAGIAICRPQTMPMLIAGAGLAAFGGTICDIDVETSDAHEQVDRMLVVAVIMVAAPKPFAQFMVADTSQPSPILGKIRG